MSLDHSLLSYIKINPNIRAKPTKLLDKNRRKFPQSWFVDGFLDLTPETQAENKKTGKLTFIKLLHCASKGTTKKVKDNLLTGRKYSQIPYLIRV